MIEPKKKLRVFTDATLDCYAKAARMEAKRLRSAAVRAQRDVSAAEKEIRRRERKWIRPVDVRAQGLQLSAPTGQIPRAWTEREKHDVQAAMRRIVAREEADRESGCINQTPTTRNDMNTPANPLPSLERLPAVCARTGLSRSEIYRLMAAGRFPKLLKISHKSSAWVSAEIDAWIADRIAERDKR